jgi:hypothetical protein
MSIDRGEEVVELFEVARVISQRVLADVTLVTQVLEELLAKVVDHRVKPWMANIRS